MSCRKQTQSEHLFEELCDQHGVGCRRLPLCEGRKQPDYELEIGDQHVIAEVKQINANDEDKRFAEALERDGVASQCRNPDVMARRIRNHIKKIRAQIKSYNQRCPAGPAILVLFDNARNKYTDPYTIQTAMHGWEQVVFDIPRNGQTPRVVDRGFAPHNNRAVRESKNQQMSALATLHECWDIQTEERFLALCFYHNSFAAHCFDPIWWHGDHIIHMTLEEKIPGKFQDWTRVLPTLKRPQPCREGGRVDVGRHLSRTLATSN